MLSSAYRPSLHPIAVGPRCSLLACWSRRLLFLRLSFFAVSLSVTRLKDDFQRPASAITQSITRELALLPTR